MWNIFKVNNKETQDWRQWCRSDVSIVNAACSSVSIVNFEQVNAGWEAYLGPRQASMIMLLCEKSLRLSKLPMLSQKSPIIVFFESWIHLGLRFLFTDTIHLLQDCEATKERQVTFKHYISRKSSHSTGNHCWSFFIDLRLTKCWVNRPWSHLTLRNAVPRDSKKLTPKSGKIQKKLKFSKVLIFTYNMYPDVLGTKCKKSRA